MSMSPETVVAVLNVVLRRLPDAAIVYDDSNRYTLGPFKVEYGPLTEGGIRPNVISAPSLTELAEALS